MVLYSFSVPARHPTIGKGDLVPEISPEFREWLDENSIDHPFTSGWELIVSDDISSHDPRFEVVWEFENAQDCLLAKLAWL